MIVQVWICQQDIISQLAGNKSGSLSICVSRLQNGGIAAQIVDVVAALNGSGENVLQVALVKAPQCEKKEF